MSTKNWNSKLNQRKILKTWTKEISKGLVSVQFEFTLNYPNQYTKSEEKKKLIVQPIKNQKSKPTGFEFIRTLFDKTNQCS